MNWISVDDRLPDKDGRYLVESNEWYGITIARFRNGEWLDYLGTDEITITADVTHWMPLPESPQSRTPHSRDGASDGEFDRMDTAEIFGYDGEPWA